MADDFRQYPFLVPPVRQRQPISARQQNKLIEEIDRRLSGLQGNAKVRNPVAEADTNTQPVIKATFRIKEILGDYLSCVAWDYQDEGDERINVAKPHQLRTSLATHNGISFTYPTTVTRTANDGSDTEDQIIIPALLVNDVIVAEKNIRGGTGVVSAAGQTIVWMADLGARHWSKVPDA